MAMEKAPKDKKFSPEKYGMIFCPDCNGLGKVTNDNEEIKVCRVCGGFGLIKKEEKNNSHDWTRQKGLVLNPDF
jgi:DnaJ-class molecular chaperone